MSIFSQSPSQYQGHVCGLYYNHSLARGFEKTYLPQIQLEAHANILSTTSRTLLKQTFVNPSTKRGIRDLRYTFPLYDGVSVVRFVCHVGDRTIVGEVKEKEKARSVFKEAVEKGQTAGLFEQLPEASDVFTTTIGNIPPSAKIVVEITYLGELKHDMETDGIRYTVPNIICPRYGAYPKSLQMESSIDPKAGSISITVDAEMPDGSFIQKIQSPTHPISMTMGTVSSMPNAEPSMSKASASLTLGSAQLDKDFILQVIAKNTGVPRAILEMHPTIPNHRALMATLVPKFSLPPERPELVFVCDRSGSMSGSRIALVIQALKVFLKSLPVGVKFNICSFGSSYSFLWPKSVTYNQQTLDEAIRHADTFTANYGGTEMLAPLQSAIERRYKDMPLDVLMLTDGETWNQQPLFSYLNVSVGESKAPIRIFTLGIGNGVSHALIEGVAKAGNGFSQTVVEDEKMDTKVVRMLKGALSPHVNDYTLEIKYHNKKTTTDEEDDFDIVEKVSDSLRLNLHLDSPQEIPQEVSLYHLILHESHADEFQKKAISLFDPTVDPDKEDPQVHDKTGEARYAHLPKVDVPKVIQTPQNIPSLFAFNRTTAYLLLEPEAPQEKPKSVVLRGTSAHGPLELEIPIETLEQPGETIHQLAAKKAISELEQGRGWLSEATDISGTLIRTKFEGRFDDMVEREAVRLGVQFQVGGKWCSFVAVEADKRLENEKLADWEWLEDEEQSVPGQTPALRANTLFGYQGDTNQAVNQGYQRASVNTSSFGGSFGGARKNGGALLGMSLPAPAPAPQATPAVSNSSPVMNAPPPPQTFQHFGHPRASSKAGTREPPFYRDPPPLKRYCAPDPEREKKFRDFVRGRYTRAQSNESSSGNAPTSSRPMSSFSSSSPIPQMLDSSCNSPFSPTNNPAGGTSQSGLSQNFGLAPQATGWLAAPTVLSGGVPPAAPSNAFTAPSNPFAAPKLNLFGSAPHPTPNKTPEDLAHHLIGLQTFEGSWGLSQELLVLLNVPDDAFAKEITNAGVSKEVFITALVIAMFEQKLKDFEGSWELVVEKAKEWLADQGANDVEGLVGKAGALLRP